jgi:hypothetical protein
MTDSEIIDDQPNINGAAGPDTLHATSILIEAAREEYGQSLNALVLLNRGNINAVQLVFNVAMADAYAAGLTDVLITMGILTQEELDQNRLKHLRAATQQVNEQRNAHRLILAPAKV